MDKHKHIKGRRQKDRQTKRGSGERKAWPGMAELALPVAEQIGQNVEKKAPRRGLASSRCFLFLPATAAAVCATTNECLKI
jgi:hypothetical protein